MIAEFAQLVGLVAAFSSERRGQKAGDFEEFLEWLLTHNHSAIRQTIERNHATTVRVKALLNQSIERLQERLDALSSQMAVLSSRLDGAAELASSYAVQALSDQALEIVSLMATHDSEYFLLSKALGEPERLVLAPGPNYRPDQAQFLHDDLGMLVELGLLREDFNSQGDAMFRFTRGAAALVAGLQ